jgi:hypothetical protein
MKLIFQSVERRLRMMTDFLSLLARVPLDRGPGARTRGTLRAGGHHRGRHGTRPRESEADRFRPAVPVDDSATGPFACGQLLDVVPGHGGIGSRAWLAEQGPRGSPRSPTPRLISGSYRAVFDAMVPDATQVADPFHW